MAVKMRRFRWIGGDPETAPELGVVAQEFQPLFPELVGSAPADPSNPAYPDRMMTVGLGGLGSIAIKALQELKQEKDGEIASLKQEITQLNEKVEQAARQTANVAQLERELGELRKLVTALAANPGATRMVQTPAEAVPSASVRLNR
jgi:uncharacterized protein involved in exopolysaccharide biosynthesis